MVNVKNVLESTHTLPSKPTQPGVVAFDPVKYLVLTHKVCVFPVIVSPVRSTYGGYYGLVVVTRPRPRPPRPQTLHRSHDNLKNPYRIASIFYM